MGEHGVNKRETVAVVELRDEKDRRWDSGTEQTENNTEKEAKELDIWLDGSGGYWDLEKNMQKWW